jgi:hypothetical protein
MAKSEPADFSPESHRSCLNKSSMHKHTVTIHEPLSDRVASGSKPHGIIAKLRSVAKIWMATGYQDETGFYIGVKPAEDKIKWPSIW